MDKHIVETFLMRIGRSYYESPEFRRQILPFEPISHFALGVMSCFMLADNVRVETDVWMSVLIEVSRLPSILRREADTSSCAPCQHSARARPLRYRLMSHATIIGDVCLGCVVDALFKMFIDADGDLCLTAPGYKDDRLNLALSGMSEDWRHSEIRAVYRHKFNHKPPSGSDSEYDEDAAMLAVVKASFRWSQDGLFVGPIKLQRPHERADEDKQQKQECLTSWQVPIPGLNAADVDLRGPWRVNLNSE